MVCRRNGLISSGKLIPSWGRKSRSNPPRLPSCNRPYSCRCYRLHIGTIERCRSKTEDTLAAPFRARPDDRMSSHTGLQSDRGYRWLVSNDSMAAITPCEPPHWSARPSRRRISLFRSSRQGGFVSAKQAPIVTPIIGAARRTDIRAALILNIALVYSIRVIPVMILHQVVAVPYWGRCGHIIWFSVHR